MQSLKNFMHFMRSRFSNSSSHLDGGEDGQTWVSSSSTLPPKQNYEVFLSFRGEDTRHGFTDHLYHGLINRGIEVFRDNEKLRVGEKIDQLFEAINASKISVLIISPDYASSIWCLKELLQILKCRETSNQLVLPIFYQVKPSDVREQKGNFGKKFRLCKKKHDLDGKLVRELENAFKEITTMKGWESDKIADRREGELVKIVVTRIFNELRKAVLVVPDFLVGVEDHIKEIRKIIDARPSNDTTIIGIHGMGGIGKTTLAKALYNELCDHFECRSFVPNIREASSQYKGMEGLQKQVISDILVDKSLGEISHVDEGMTIIEKSFKGKKLLLLLDDVEDKDQLNNLAMKNNWFGSKSIVIITTRNKDVTIASTVNLSYELNELDYDQSYKLFCKHAFGRDASCPRDLETIAEDIVSMTGGLPLAIEIIGSYLNQNQKVEGIWNVTLKKLRRIPNNRVQDRLKISYDALEHEQQQIFLDIACLSIGNELESASYMWDSCGFYPEEGIQILISLSLIKIGDQNHLVMHDQLRDLGREIVRKEGQSNIGMCSRLWLEEEAREVIEGKQGTTKVQALDLDIGTYEDEVIRCTSQQFESMMNLRYLRLGDVHLVGDFKNHFFNLRWLQWGDYGASIDFMGINFNPKKLVHLELYGTNITEHWEGWSLNKNLRVLRLHDCGHLTATPDFSMLKELEVLALIDCWSLGEIDGSIGNLSKTLKVLEVDHSKKLVKLPTEVGKMEELRKLSIKDCMQLTDIPNSLGSLFNLRCLKLYRCPALTIIPESIGMLKLLTELNFNETGIRELPTSLGMLGKLRKLELHGCKELKSLPKLPCSLTSLAFNANSMENLPDISNLTNLDSLTCEDLILRRNGALNLENLNQLKTLWISNSNKDASNSEKEVDMAPESFNLLLELPLSLVQLQVSGCHTLQALPNLSNLKNLSWLLLVNCSGLMEINGLEGAESLTWLSIENCKRLSKLSGLGTMMTNLRLKSLEALESLPDLSTVKKLKDLTIDECRNLVVIQGIGDIEDLQHLVIDRCSSLDRIGGLEKLTCLTLLSLVGCKSLQYLPDLSQFTNLEQLFVPHCEKLTKIQGLENLTSLKVLDITGCTALKTLPNLPNVDIISD